MIDRTYYPDAVAKLLDHGLPEGDVDDVDSWFDYRAHYGFDEIDVVSLIDLMGENMNRAPSASNDSYASIHACRALAQLGDTVTEDYFYTLIDRSCNYVLVRNARAALRLLPRSQLRNLESYFYDSRIDDDYRMALIDQACELVRADGELRETCISFLRKALADYARYSPGLNGMLIHYLIQLKATKASDEIQAALASGKTEDEITGPWPAVQVALGLAKKTDFSEDELLCASDRQRKQERNSAVLLPQKPSPRQQQRRTITQLTGGYSITEHLKSR